MLLVLPDIYANNVAVHVPLRGTILACVERGSLQQDFPPFSGEECVNKNLNCVRAERAVVYSYALPSKFVRAERAVCSMASIAGQQPGFHLFNCNFSCWN